MKLRAWATLLMAFIMMISTVSEAQWGYGMYGGMQMCPYGYGAASGASSEDDEIAELQEERADLRREKREAERTFRQIERDLDTLRESITDVVKSNWATVALEHMDKGMNCSVCGSGPGPVAGAPATPATPAPTTTGDSGPGLRWTPAPTPYRERITIDESTGPGEVVVVPTPRPATPTPRPATPTPAPIVVVPPPPVRIDPPNRPRPPRTTPTPKPPPTKPGDGSSLDRDGGGRMPASETANREPAQVSAGARVTGGEAVGGGNFGEDFGADIGEQAFGADGSPTLCNPNRQPYTMNAWKIVCRGEGKISDRLCRDKYFQQGGIKPAQANACARSLDRYRKSTIEMAKIQKIIDNADSRIADIGYKIGDIKMSRRLDRDMEADCPAGDGSCYDKGSSRTRKSRGPSLGQTLLSVGMDALQIGASVYMGNKANEWRARTGHEALPYVAQGIMSGAYFPYRTAGLYGGMYGGVNGGFGCSPTMGGGGMQMGPYGMMGPYGIGGGIYGGVGSPFGYPGMVGGYPQYGGGMFNPGMGPWGMNGPWGVGGWPGGYPGMGGFVGGIAGSIAGGFAMPGMAGGYMGMAGGMVGGMAGGFAMPGMAGYMGMAGGMAGGFAMPGMAGYMGMAGGMAGGFAMPGMAGGMAGGYMGMPGYAGGYAGGFAGGMAGMAGMAGGFASPWGIAGGMAGGFMTGMSMDPTLMQQQYQLQLEAQRRYSEQASSRMRLYNGFMQEYMQFQMKWNQYFGNGSAGTDMFNPGGSTVPVGGSGPGVGTSPGRTR